MAAGRRVLWRSVLAVAGLALTGLTTAQSSAGTIARLPDPLEAGWRGRKVCEPLYENDRVRAARCTFPPGAGHERHRHAPHWGYIVEGSTMRITNAAGTTVRELKPGASWWSDGFAWHEALNVGATTGVYVIVEPKRRDGVDR